MEEASRIGRSGEDMLAGPNWSLLPAAGSHVIPRGLDARAPAAPGPTWKVQAIPSPPGGGTLDDMACASASSCTAVGSFGANTLAERWDGTSWAIQSTPNPSRLLTLDLSGVSCSSADACTAVGYYQTSSGYFTLAERWDGTSWAIQSTPNPSRSAFSRLSTVACTSASLCIAVGDAGPNMLAELWNGTSWTIQKTPRSGAGVSALPLGISCTAASACTVVGFDQTSSGSGTLAERWNGTSWAIQSTPHPSGSTDSSLSTVSCASGTACTAVGYSDVGTLAERWNGRSWSIQNTPSPGGPTSSALLGVACTSASACTAVGWYFHNRINSPLAETE
jgi:hypothetical protein